MSVPWQVAQDKRRRLPLRSVVSLSALLPARIYSLCSAPAPSTSCRVLVREDTLGTSDSEPGLLSFADCTRPA